MKRGWGGGGCRGVMVKAVNSIYCSISHIHSAQSNETVTAVPHQQYIIQVNDLLYLNLSFPYQRHLTTSAQSMEALAGVTVPVTGVYFTTVNTSTERKG